MSLDTHNQLVDRLMHTIEHGLVKAVYQPIVDIGRAEICAYEALTRPAPESDFPSPIELFDAAEACGMLWELETVTRRQALAQASNWPAGVLLFLNCTPQVIADDRFTETILAEIDQTPGLSPRRIVLEVTERSDNQHVEGLHRQTLKLQQHGFQLAIDDVGAGTSGLNRIMLLRPQWLKLDRELVEKIDHDPVRTNLVRFLSHFARLSGVSIIGEGVEREAELEQLVRLGVSCVQGYLIGKPGEHSRELPEPIVERIRAESRRTRAAGFSSERSERLARLVRPAYIVDSRLTVAEVARDLLNQPTVKGVVVTDGGYYSGWCPRDRICRVDSEDGEGRTISSIAGPISRTLHIGMSIDEALDLASSIRDGQFDRPLILTESGRVIGAVEMRDLLTAAAQACRSVQHRVAPLTGLPGRIPCEQRLEEHIARGGKADAAFVDLKGLSEYNAVFGFDLGDDLIRQLVEVIDQVVHERGGNPAESFIGHIGDDRFMLLLPPGEVESIAHDVIRLYQSRVSSFGISPQAALAGLGGATATPTIAVRFLAIRGFSAHYDSAQDVIRAEATLRALADEQAAMSPIQPGYFVCIEPEPAPCPFHLAA